MQCSDEACKDPYIATEPLGGDCVIVIVSFVGV